MNISQIIEALPPQVYVRRGELVIHFSSPADLVNRLAETSASLSDLEVLRAEAKPDGGGRRGTLRRATGSTARSEIESQGDAEPPVAG